MQEGHFQLEFERFSFPVRFSVVVVLILAALWTNWRINHWQLSISAETVVAQLTLAAVFTVLSLLVLRFCSDIFSQVRSRIGMLLGFSIVAMVAASIHLAVYLSIDALPDLWSKPYLRKLDSDTTLLLVCLTLILGWPLFWLEKQIFSIRAQARAAEITQFTNLGFRIRPHFLFNTLNSVAHLIGINPGQAEKALHNLADVFRVVMADKRELVPLKAELELADKYLYLEKTRLGDRLSVASRIDPESLGVMVPVLLLQPLLENAVYHGIETRFKGGTINISVQVVANQLLIQIANPLPEGRMKRGTGNKVAQENLRDRIYRTFGSRGTFDAHEADDRYTVTLRLPL